MRPARYASGVAVGRTFSAFDFRVIQSDRLSANDLATIYGLFEANYRDANRRYLDRSLGRLRYVSIASSGGEPVGFALGDARVMDLPRLPAQPVHMAGICCVSTAFRRQGLFGELERRALGANPLPPSDRVLTAGRMAHPASFRGMAANPTVVPRTNQTPSEWQQEVGAAIADAYGNPAFDPVHFVVLGSGEPIGWPIIEIEASPDEWLPFANVDRSRGDAVLGIAWRPTAPPGW